MLIFLALLIAWLSIVNRNALSKLAMLLVKSVINIKKISNAISKISNAISNVISNAYKTLTMLIEKHVN